MSACIVPPFKKPQPACNKISSVVARFSSSSYSAPSFVRYEFLQTGIITPFLPSKYQWSSNSLTYLQHACWLRYQPKSDRRVFACRARASQLPRLTEVSPPLFELTSPPLAVCDSFEESSHQFFRTMVRQLLCPVRLTHIISVVADSK